MSIKETITVHNMKTENDMYQSQLNEHAGNEEVHSKSINIENDEKL